MKIHHALEPILSSVTKLRLLRTIIGSPERRWTGRELARGAQVSTAQAARNLAEIAESALVLREVVGRSYSWQVNSSHVLLPILADLFKREAGLRSELVRTVSEALRPARPERVRLFGSVPRGEERADSDVDLFFEIRSSADRELAEEALERVRSRVWDKFGNPVSALIYTRDQLARPSNPRLLEAIEREGIDLGKGAG